MGRAVLNPVLYGFEGFEQSEFEVSALSSFDIRKF